MNKLCRSTDAIEAQGIIAKVPEPYIESGPVSK